MRPSYHRAMPRIGQHPRLSCMLDRCARAFPKNRGSEYHRKPEKIGSWSVAVTSITVNNQVFGVDAAADTPLLWVLRDHLSMTGTKYGCGMALCGACTVHIDGVATRSCVTPLSLAAGKQITTIEGLAQNGNLHPVQKAWLEHDVPQCGYCQSGMIMAVAPLLREQPKPTDDDI